MTKITLGSDLFERKGNPWDNPKLPRAPTPLTLEVTRETVNPFERYERAEGYRRERVKPRYRPDPRPEPYERGVNLRLIERATMAGYHEAERELERGGRYLGRPPETVSRVEEPSWDKAAISAAAAKADADWAAWREAERQKSEELQSQRRR